MNKNFGAELKQLIDELYNIHIELWDIVEMKKSTDDQVVAIAAKNNNRLVKLRSDNVERIDEIVIQALKINKQGEETMPETIGELIEQLGFEKIRIHENNRINGGQEKSTQTCEDLKQKLQDAINAALKISE